MPIMSIGCLEWQGSDDTATTARDSTLATQVLSISGTPKQYHNDSEALYKTYNIPREFCPHNKPTTSLHSIQFSIPFL